MTTAEIITMLIMAVSCLGVVVQVIAVPLIAARKDIGGCLWGLVTLMWTASTLLFQVWGLPMIVIGYGLTAHDGTIGGWILMLGVLMAVTGYLPLIAVYMSKDRNPRVARRRARPERPRCNEGIDTRHYKRIYTEAKEAAKPK